MKFSRSYEKFLHIFIIFFAGSNLGIIRLENISGCHGSQINISPLVTSGRNNNTICHIFVASASASIRIESPFNFTRT